MSAIVNGSSSNRLPCSLSCLAFASAASLASFATCSAASRASRLAMSAAVSATRLNGAASPCKSSPVPLPSLGRSLGATGSGVSPGGRKSVSSGSESSGISRASSCAFSSIIAFNFGSNSAFIIELSGFKPGRSPPISFIASSDARLRSAAMSMSPLLVPARSFTRQLYQFISGWSATRSSNSFASALVCLF